MYDVDAALSVMIEELYGIEQQLSKHGTAHPRLYAVKARVLALLQIARDTQYELSPPEPDYADIANAPLSESPF